MDRRAFFGRAATALAALALPGCALADDTPDYRYRLTVEVDTPEGLRTGSSVIEVSTDVTSQYSIPDPGSVRNRTRGEAVAVDLPGGHTLFALLRSDSEVDWASHVMFLLTPTGPQTGTAGFLEDYHAMLANRALRELPATFPDVGHIKDRPARPMLVTFADLADPTSVARVDPDDLAATFGEGVTLRRVTVQLTDDPVTTGIEERLGWLNSYRQLHLDGTSTVSEDMTTTELSAHLTAGSFSTEFAR